MRSVVLFVKMPHLLVERLREFPKFFTSNILIEVLDITAGVIFVIGSVCFLPEYEHELQVFLFGVISYVVGSAIYVGICTATVTESIATAGLMSFEAAENALYLVGSWVFFWGTFLYWPKKADTDIIETMKEISVGQQLNLFSPEFEGTILFIVGSAMFAFAAFVNALNQRRFEDLIGKLLTAVTSLYMAGSILFCMGSVAFLPDLGCNEQMLRIGAWCFIIGSLFYTIGGCLSLYRTILVMQPEHQAEVKALDPEAK